MEIKIKQSQNTAFFIKNSHAFVDILKVYTEEIPIVKESNSNKNLSYVTSLSTQYILYTREEVLKSPKYLKKQKYLARYVAPVAYQFAKVMLRNRIIWINNNLTSTPLYNSNWDNIDILKLSRSLSELYPNKFIIFKSLEPLTDEVFFNKFAHQDFIPLLGRQVYIFDPQKSNYKKKRSFQMDRKLAKNQKRFYWSYLDLNNDSDITRVLDLYKKLYIEKHSLYNPVYTENFIKNGFGNFKLRFEVLKDKENDSIVAVQGIQETDRIINTCYIGYDQSLPTAVGLYRMMNYELMNQAIEKNKILNMSSGAGDFKMKRGATASFEYQMIYKKNLSKRYIKFWTFFANSLENKVKKQMQGLKV